MPAKSVSFRTHLTSNSMDLLTQVGLDCVKTARLITGIVSQLAAYTEEGVSMAPSVFICNSVANLVQVSGVGEHISLSEPMDLQSAASKILKAAAPLCGDNWKIYVERSEDGATCTFGVFCGTTDPSSLAVDEVLLAEKVDNYPIIRIIQTSKNKVEVKTNVGGSIEFRFNDDVDVAELDVMGSVGLLAGSIANDVPADQVHFASFVGRVLTSAIGKSHGTLVAVLDSNKPQIPESLSDVVKIAPPLDLYERFNLHIEEGKTAGSVSRLQAAVDLLVGLISSDGITVFDSRGRVIGYRAFIKSDGQPAQGGARTRAFEAMKALVGGDLKAAFFRSQDGRVEFKSVDAGGASNE